jgi:drug/metabolite transporter (DMT)-like permease
LRAVLIRGEDRTAAAAFAVCTSIIATNPVAVRFSDRELAPSWGACLRFGLATAIFAGLALALRLPLPRGRALAGAVLFGALNYAGAVGLAYYAFVHVHAGIGQILFALGPLATLLLAVAQRQEHLGARAVVGALLALGGVALLTTSPLRGQAPVLSLLALLGSLLCVSESAVLARRLPSLHPVQLNLVASPVAALILLPISRLSGESIALPHSAATWTAFVYLVVVSSVLMFILYLVMLARWAASRAAYVFVLSPPLTLALSAWLDNEHVSSALFLGGAVILAGVYVGALRPRRTPVPAVPSP